MCANGTAQYYSVIGHVLTKRHSSIIVLYVHVLTVCKRHSAVLAVLYVHVLTVETAQQQYYQCYTSMY